MTASAIVITGTPGTGKSTITNKLKEMGYTTVNLFDFAKEYNCVGSYDEDRKSYLVNMDKLYDSLEHYLESIDELVVFEGHYGDIVPDSFVSRVFVLTTNISILRERLKERNYSKDKIDENIQAEIMQICWTDALEEFGPNKVTKIANASVDEATKIITTYLQSKKLNINN